MDEWITLGQYLNSWTFSEEYNEENIFTEISAYKHLKFLDLFLALMVMGDVGARIYLYYMGSGKQLQNQNTTTSPCEERQMNWVDYGTQMSQ